MGKGEFHNTEKSAPVTIAEWEEHAHVGGVEGGPAYKVTNFPAYSLLVDEASASTTYLGEAVVGTATSAASWRVRKIVVSGTVTSIQWASSAAWTQIWDNRASLTYS
jgi:hypothetical protein